MDHRAALPVLILIILSPALSVMIHIFLVLRVYAITAVIIFLGLFDAATKTPQLNAKMTFIQHILTDII